MKSLAQEYLENIREAFTYLSHDSGSGFFSTYSSIPLLMLVFVIATANSIITCILGSAFALTVFLATSIRQLKAYKSPSRDYYSAVLKNILVLSLMVLVVSAPILLLRGLSSVSMFLARTISSTIVFILMIRVIGWWNIVGGLEKIRAPRILVEMIYQTVKFIPLFLGETLKLLVARDARILGKTRISSLWRVLSSIVGELIVKAYYRSTILDMALRARTLSYSKHGVGGGREYLTVYDACLITVTAALLLYEVLDKIWSGI